MIDSTLVSQTSASSSPLVRVRSVSYSAQAPGGFPQRAAYAALAIPRPMKHSTPKTMRIISCRRRTNDIIQGTDLKKQTYNNSDDKFAGRLLVDEEDDDRENTDKDGKTADYDGPPGGALGQEYKALKLFFIFAQPIIWSCGQYTVALRMSTIH